MQDLLSILPEDVTVRALADNDVARHGTVVEGHEVIAPSALSTLSFDFIIIAARAVDPIRKGLEALGVQKEQIIAYYPSYSAELAASANRDLNVLGGELGITLPRIGLTSMYMWPDDDCKTEPPADFVRHHAMRLAATHINARGVAGAIAELGVYQGETAAELNRLFPERSLYLFDTFSGFDMRDLTSERTDGLSVAATGHFADTSVQKVLDRLPHAERAIVRQGFFPETAGGLEDETFAFVSLDVDLHDPTLAGLEWFYPRLSSGGCIFVHDYNNRRYLGVRKAVDTFLSTNSVPSLQLPDFAGSIVILR